MKFLIIYRLRMWKLLQSQHGVWLSMLSQEQHQDFLHTHMEPTEYFQNAAYQSWLLDRSWGYLSQWLIDWLIYAIFGT